MGQSLFPLITVVTEQPTDVMDKNSTAFANSVKDAMVQMKNQERRIKRAGVRKAPARRRITAERKKQILDEEWQGCIRKYVPVLAEGLKMASDEAFLSAQYRLFAQPKEGLGEWVDQTIAAAALTETECAWYARLMKHLSIPNLGFGAIALFFKEAWMKEERDRLEKEVTDAACEAAATCSNVASGKKQ